jgi:hypothetical protein
MTVDAVSDLDLSYTPPLGSPWEAIQAGAPSLDATSARALESGSILIVIYLRISIEVMIVDG